VDVFEQFSWSFEQRRVMLAELQTMRRLEVLIRSVSFRAAVQVCLPEHQNVIKAFATNRTDESLNVAKVAILPRPETDSASPEDFVFTNQNGSPVSTASTSPPSPRSPRPSCWSWSARSTSPVGKTSSRSNSGTGKTHVALALGLAACQKGLAVGFTTVAALVNELHEARDEKGLLSSSMSAR
jgi:hypothetical protein